MKCRKTKGFTLLELLIYVAVLSVSLLAITSVFMSFNRGKGNIESRAEVNSNLRFVTEKIASDLRSASFVSVPAAGSSSNVLEMTIGGSTVVYDVISGRLRRQTDAGAPDIITSPGVVVAVPVFTRAENTNTVLDKTAVSIGIELSISYNGSNPDYQYTESGKTAVSLRQ